MGDAVVGKVDGGQFAAPKCAGVEGEDVVGVHKAQRRPVSEDDGVAEVLPVWGFKPRAQVRGHFFESRFVVVVEFVFQSQCAHSGEDVDNHAQAVVAGQVVAPFGGFVSVHFGEKLFVFFAAQLGFGFAGEQFGAGDGPLGQDAGVNHNMAHAFDQQGLEAQPIEHFFAVGVLEDGGDGVASLDRAFAVTDGEQVQVMVAENHADAAFVFHAELEDFEGFGAAVDDVADEPEGICTVVEVDFVEQKGEFVEAALNIADCVVCHCCYCPIVCGVSDDLWLVGGRLKTGCVSYAFSTSTASASTCTPLGREATPTAARAGKGSWMNSAMTSLKTAKLARSVR